jgi:hypothetical protein
MYAIFIYASKHFMYCDVWCDKNLCNCRLARIIIKLVQKNVPLWYAKYYAMALYTQALCMH